VKFRTEELRVVAEDRGEEVGSAELRVEGGEVWVEHLHARRPGVEEPLLRQALAQVRELERRLLAEAGAGSFGRVFVQTDDETAVERAVRTFVPRLGRSEQTVVHLPRNGWIEVEDELCSREPSLLRRLARELSDRTGAVVLLLGIEDGAVVRYILLERGRIADEYASVPEFHGPLPSGDVVALGANPTVVARLTGAEPAQVRAVARTAATPGELPPVEDLYRQLAELLGVGSEG
jgi:hypothetical protein